MRIAAPRLSLALGAALALVVATPATAAPYASLDDIAIGDYTWTLQAIDDDYPFAVDDTDYDDGDFSAWDAWDYGHFGVWDDEANLDVDRWHEFGCANADLSAPDSNGDRVVTCDGEETDLGLDLEAEIRLYGEGDLARFLVTISNPSVEPIDYSWEYYVNFGETDLRATSTVPSLGENTYVNTDIWSYNFSRDTLNAVVAWGIPDSTLNHEGVDDVDVDDLWIWNDADDDTQLTMAPGESVTLAFFQKVDVGGTVAARDGLREGSAPAESAETPEGAEAPAAVEGIDAGEPSDDAEATTAERSTSFLTPAAIIEIDAEIAAATAEFATFDGRLVRGLAAGIEVANWGVVAGETPELAETGSDQGIVIGALIGGGGLLALGVVLLVVRRSRRGA